MIRIQFPADWDTSLGHLWLFCVKKSRKTVKNCTFWGDPNPCEAVIHPKGPKISENLLLHLNPGNPRFCCDLMTSPFLHFFKNGLQTWSTVVGQFLKKWRKGKVIGSQRNVGLPGFTYRRRFSESLGCFGLIAASHGLGSPQNRHFLRWSEPMWGRYPSKGSQNLRKYSPTFESR